MKIIRKALLYDIANMAFTIADTGEHNRHTLHRVRDICEEGNIDRVNNMLSLSYSKVLVILLPLLSPPHFHKIHENNVFSSPISDCENKECKDPEGTQDFIFHLRKDSEVRFSLTKERIMNIKETIHEFMVCSVLADWLSVTLPEAADVWKFRADSSLDAIKEIVTSIISSLSTSSLRRKLNPF